MQKLVIFEETEEKKQKIELSITQAHIYDTLKKHGPLKRGYKHSKEKTLRTLTNIPRTTLYDNLEKLEQKGLIERFKASSNGKRGRPPIRWRLKKNEEEEAS